jgi:histone demethylase JARID1
MYYLVEDGVVLECELCLERLPAGSVPMPRVVGGKARPTSLKEVKFLCPCCLRSRRPRYGGYLRILKLKEKPRFVSVIYMSSDNK